MPAAPHEALCSPFTAIGARDQPDAQNQGCSCNFDDEEYAFQSLLKDSPQPAMPDFNANKLHHMPEGSKDPGWQQCLKAVEKHDADLCQAYREQIDTLLVFAGLFSAVVTAFAVESYQWLLDDPADTSADLLQDVVRLLAQNLNQTVLPRPIAARLSDAAIVRINVFWFLSLTLSLSAALVGILCKQWLREFERDVGQSPETAIGVRFIRYQGLGYWKVGSIVNSVPILLQVALALFLTGIVELLWRISFTVAVCVTMVAAVTLTFYIATTLLPLIQYTDIILRLWGSLTPRLEKHIMDKAFAEPQCAFKSAQAWIVLRAVQPILEYVMERHCHIFLAYNDDSNSLVLRPADSWITFDINWLKRRDRIHWGPRSAYESLAWVAANLDERHLNRSIWQCAWARWLQTLTVKGDHVPAALDLECVARAFPEPIHLGTDTKAYIRVQAALFRCSLHTTIHANTAVEIILRIAPVIGIGSRWTCEAMRTVRAVYRDQSIHLSEEMAFGLLRLAMLQTQAIVQQQIPDGDAEIPSAQATAAFAQVFELLCTGAAEFHKDILPAMCALALQLLRAHPGQISAGPPWKSNADCAKMMINTMISYYASSTSDPSRLRAYRGIIFPARLARMVLDLYPYLARFYAEYAPQGDSILRTLLEISESSGNAHTAAVCASCRGKPPTAAPLPSVQDDEGGLPPSALAAHGDAESCAPSIPDDVAVHTGGEGGDSNSASSPQDSLVSAGRNS